MSGELMINEMASLVTKLTESQVTLNNSFVGLNVRLSNAESEQKRMTDILNKRVYIAGGDKIEIRKHVSSVISEIIKSNSWKYDLSYRMLIKAIYDDVNGQYNCTTYHELPAIFKDEIIRKLNRGSQLKH